MKIEVKIADHLKEETVRVEGPAYSQRISQVVDFVKGLDQVRNRLKAKKGQEVHLLEIDRIYRLVIEDKVVHIKTATQDFTSSDRLYQFKGTLPVHFLQISQSEIINLNQLDHLQLTPNGLVKLILKNGEVTYSSRRYLSSIKEALAL